MRQIPAYGRTAAAALLSATLAATLASCTSSSGNAPDTASSVTAVPGSAPQLGQGSGGAITITGVTITRSGNTLAVSGRVADSGPGDVLMSVGSQVTQTLQLNPAIQVPAGGAIDLSSGHRVVLTQNAPLDPGGTIDLVLHFRTAGDVQVFASFTDG